VVILVPFLIILYMKQWSYIAKIDQVQDKHDY
jgi:hypothetical protein